MIDPSQNRERRNGLSILSLSMIFAASLVGAEYHVSSNGRNENPGTRELPFATVSRARDAIRESNVPGGNVVWIDGGRYFFDRTIEFGDRDSGTKNEPNVYKAVPGESVYFDGGVVLDPAGCEAVTDHAVRRRLVETARHKVLRVDLKRAGITDFGALGHRGFRRAYLPAPLELFIDAEPQTIARWPNKGDPHIPLGTVVDPGSSPRTGDYGLKPAVFRYETERARRWVSSADMYISGYFHYGFADDTLKVAKLDVERGTITTELPHLYGFKKAGHSQWFALNLLEEIDQAGEYFVDRAAGVLYFYPPAGFHEGSLLQLSMLKDVMLAFEGAAHIRFEGITFENSRGTAIYIERGDSIVVAGCTFRNLGMLAVQMGQGTEPYPDGLHDAHGDRADGKDGVPASRIVGNWHEYLYRHTAWDRDAGVNHRILSCDIYNTGCGGVLLGGGNRKTLKPANNSVENCDIWRVNRLELTYKAPVNLDGVGNRVVNNRIHRTEGMAIYFHGNDHLIEFNDIHDVLLDVSDQGAIYSGRDPSEGGTMIRYNFFHDIRTPGQHQGGWPNQAIFFDDWGTNTATIFGNVFHDAGRERGAVFFHGGGESAVINNIFIECGASPLGKSGASTTDQLVGHMQSADLMRRRLFENVDISQPPYSEKYPVVDQLYRGKRELAWPFERNYVVEHDLSQFVDPANGNFQLKEDSSVYERIPGFQPIPFARMGLYPDEFRKHR